MLGALLIKSIQFRDQRLPYDPCECSPHRRRLGIEQPAPGPSVGAVKMIQNVPVPEMPCYNSGSTYGTEVAACFLSKPFFTNGVIFGECSISGITAKTWAAVMNGAMNYGLPAVSNSHTTTIVPTGEAFLRECRHSPDYQQYRKTASPRHRGSLAPQALIRRQS